MTPLAERLAALTDELNTLLAEAAAAFLSLGLGVKAAVPMGEDWWLGFGKHNEAWCLFVVTPAKQVLPLANASRERRIQAVAVLDALQAELFKEADKQCGFLTEANNQLKKWLGK